MNLPDNSLLDTLISITLIYALLSILVSVLIEWWNHRQKSRAKMLHQSILQLLKDPLNLDYGYLFYSHYTITGLKSTENRPPQYISSSTFADVLIDIISQQAKKTHPIQQSVVDGMKTFSATAPVKSGATAVESFKLGLDTMKNSPFKDLLLSFVDKSGNDYATLKPLLESWYNDYMDRVTGWYKTAQQGKFIFFGFVVAIALNVDSLHLLKIISLDPQFRKTLVAHAENTVNQYEADTLKSVLTNEKIRFYLNNDTTATAKNNKERLTKMVSLVDSIDKANYLKIDSTMWTIEQLNIPVGWAQNTAPLSWRWPDCKDTTAKESKTTASLTAYNEERNHPQSCWTIFKYFLGICISGFSLSFGTPFWFDLLVKFVNIRRAGKKPETSSTPKS